MKCEIYDCNNEATKLAEGGPVCDACALATLAEDPSVTISPLPKWSCSCTHAPEQHGPSGCEAESLWREPCPCKVPRRTL